MPMVPNAAREEWRRLLTATEVPPLHSLSLKLKLGSLRANVKIETITLEKAIQELRQYCAANEAMYAKDLSSIFQNQ